MLRFLAFHAYQLFLLIICMAAVWIAIPFAIALLGAIFSDPSPWLPVLFLWLLLGPFVAFYAARRFAGPMRIRLRPKEALVDGLASTLSALTAFLLTSIGTAWGFWWWFNHWPCGEFRRFYETWPPAHIVAFSPDGNYFASGDGSHNTVSVRDIRTGNKIHAFEAGESVMRVAYSPDGKYIMGLTVNGALHIWDINAGTQVPTITSSELRFASACWCPDSQSILSSESDGTVRQWQCAPGQELRRFKGVPSTGGWSSVACSADGQRVVYGGKCLIIWDLKSGRELQRLPPPKSSSGPPGPRQEFDEDIESAVLSPDGKLIAFAAGNFVRVLDIASGKTILRKERRWPAFAFHPDGKKLITANGLIYIWDITTGKELGRISPTGRGCGYILSLAVSPDGRFILTASKQQSDILLWQMPQNPDSKLDGRGSP
jgi:WD40 repeat protein